MTTTATRHAWQVVVLALLVTLASVLGAARPAGAQQQSGDDDWESFVCTEGGGIYVDRPNGGWECLYPDGSKISCDAGESPDRDECETSGPGLRPAQSGQQLAPGASTVLAPGGASGPTPGVPPARRNSR